MRIFLAGATGVIGSRILRLMTTAGHVVAGMTRTEAKLDEIAQVGGLPVLCDLFDASLLVREVKSFAPDIVMHQVTDLPDEVGRIGEFLSRNNKVRSEGTRNLIEATKEVDGAHLVAQSIAWPGGGVVKAHENAVLDLGGTVIRYGQFYGPDTYYEKDVPPPPRIQIDDAAYRTMALFPFASGEWTLVDA